MIRNSLAVIIITVTVVFMSNSVSTDIIHLTLYIKVLGFTGL